MSWCPFKGYDREGTEGAAGGRIVEREGLIEEFREDPSKKLWKG